jgi:hypothetical protein
LAPDSSSKSSNHSNRLICTFSGNSGNCATYASPPANSVLGHAKCVVRCERFGGRKADTRGRWSSGKRKSMPRSWFWQSTWLSHALEGICKVRRRVKEVKSAGVW